MLKPGFIFHRQLAAIYKSFHSHNILLIPSTIFSRHFCFYPYQSVTEATAETMSSKNNKKTKLSDSESASTGSGSGSDSDSSPSPPPPRKDAKTKSKSDNDSKTKTSSSESSKGNTKSLRVAKETEPTWELGSQKFITVRDFKGKTYINVREYYEKDGKVLPGKKGISLNVEQWQNLVSSIDEVNQVLKK